MWFMIWLAIDRVQLQSVFLIAALKIVEIIESGITRLKVNYGL